MRRATGSDSADNAPADSLFNNLKNEPMHGTIQAARADAQAGPFEYIEVYNRSRSHCTPRLKSSFILEVS